MLKMLLSEVAHGYVRDRALEAVDRLSAQEVRSRIHQGAPVLGRVYTLVTSEEAQRGKLRRKIGLHPGPCWPAARGPFQPRHAPGQTGGDLR